MKLVSGIIILLIEALLTVFHWSVTYSRADVLISQPVEKLWRLRSFPGIEDVKWTYVGMRSGVFRTYPGHRSRRGYDPSKYV